jgi:ribosomal protein L7/L12
MRSVPARLEVGCPECGATVEVRLRAWVSVLSPDGRLAVEQAYQAPHKCVEPTFRVVLLETGEKKIQVIKAIREMTGLGLRESKDLADTPGEQAYVAVGLTSEIEAVKMARHISDVGAGARAEVRRSNG